MALTRRTKGESPADEQAALETFEPLGARDLLATPGRGAAPALTILYHPSLERVGEVAVLHELAAGAASSLSRTSPSFRRQPLEDQNISRRPMRLTMLPDRGVRISLGECRTRVSIRGKPLQSSIDLSADDVQRGVVLELAGRVVLLLHNVPAMSATGTFTSGSDDTLFADLVGESAAMQRLKQDIRRVADLDVPVLIRGETGSGKELVARAIHDASERRGAPYEPVNLGEIPASLASSTLFGAEKGAHSMADRRQLGYFRQARGGTIFLDEVGEAPPEVQVALLRVLETGEIRPLGSDQIQKVDVRIIAATDADLEAKIGEGSFRAPILHRLAAYEIWVPPLRERRDDIGRLLVHFFREELSNPKIGEAHRLESAPQSGELWFPASLVAQLAEFDWPGNVRQLRNVIRQIVIHSRGRSHAAFPPAVERQLHLSTPSKPLPLAAAPTPTPAPAEDSRAVSSEGRRRPADVTEEELVAALREARWDRTAAAVLLRISRASLYALMEKSQRFRSEDATPEEVARAWDECGGDVERMVERLEVSERTIRWRLRKLGLLSAAAGP